MLARNKEISIGNGNNDLASTSEARCVRFPLSEIRSATEDFDAKLVIGIGGFGKVYKGTINYGDIDTTVAIKRLNPESKQGANEFWTEVEMLSELRHTHLVSLIGYCNEGEEMILVYEYMENGTIADHLYKIRQKRDGNCGDTLNWEQRINICIGAARGLHYLHSGTQKITIHRDVKSTNILLDGKWVAKISDFGLSKNTTLAKTHVSTGVKGTFGYLDPDYFLTKKLTTKSDVYAFGIVMLEVLCGRPAVDETIGEEPLCLDSWVQDHKKEGTVDQIIDPTLRGQISPYSLKCFLKLSEKCLLIIPKLRPTMAQVVRKLELVLASKDKERKDGIFTKVLHSFNHSPNSMKQGSRKTRSMGSVGESSRVWHGEALSAERCLSEPSRGSHGETVLETPAATPQRRHSSLTEVLSTHKVFR